MTIIKNKIIELRNQKALTQKQFALACGLSGSVVSQYEQGFRNPSNKALYSICDAFEIDPSYFNLPPKIEFIERGKEEMQLREEQINRLIQSLLDDKERLQKELDHLKKKMTYEDSDFEEQQIYVRSEILGNS